MTNPSRLSDFLLEQFEAICRFEQKIHEYQSGKMERYRIQPHQAKKWYAQEGYSHLLQDTPWVVELCQELEKTVPLDHDYWYTQSAIQ